MFNEGMFFIFKMVSLEYEKKKDPWNLFDIIARILTMPDTRPKSSRWRVGRSSNALGRGRMGQGGGLLCDRAQDPKRG